MHESDRPRYAGSTHTLRRALGYAVCGMMVVVAVACFWRASGANAQTSTLRTVGQVSNSSTHYRAWVIDARTADDNAQATDSMEAAELMTTERKPVQAGRDLELVAFVHEPDGRPVHRAQVRFEWSDQRGTVTLKDATDAHGIARVRRWVARGERQHATTVRVSVQTEEWRTERAVWFVPR